MSVSMRTWLAKAKGLGNGDSNPLLNEEEKKQPLDSVGDDENPWGTLNEDNGNDLQSAPSRQSKKRGKNPHLLGDDNYQQLDSNSDHLTPPNSKHSHSGLLTPNRPSRPYLVPPARLSAQVALKPFPSPFSNISKRAKADKPR